MSPPIRDGSGNSIGAIRLGDGSEIAEVRTGAGDVLFSAIPDSVDFRWPITDDSTTTLNEVESGNSVDGTLQSGNYVSGLGTGGIHINLDSGNNDFADVSHGGTLDDSTFTLLGWCNPDDASRSDQELWRNGNPNRNIRLIDKGSGTKLNCRVFGYASGFDEVGRALTNGTWEFFAFAVQSDGTTNATAIYQATASDSNVTQTAVGTVSGSVSGQTKETWGEDPSNRDGHFNGQLDHFAYASGSAMSQSEVESFFDVTKGDHI